MTNDLNESFGTLSETTNGLKKAGYTLDFNILEECIICHQTNRTFSPEDFHIDKVYRFEGDSNPDDESIVYAISSSSFGVKGILVNGYGPSDDAATSKLVERLHTSDAPGVVDAIPSQAEAPAADEPSTSALTEINLYKSISQLKVSPAWKAGNPASMPIFNSDGMRVMLMGLPDGAEMKPHTANGVISVQVLEGGVNFSAGDHRAIITKGQMIGLPAKVTHSIEALSETFFLLTVALSKDN